MHSKPDIYTIDRAQLYAVAAVCEANRNRRDAVLLRAAGDYIYTARPKRKGKRPFLDAWFEANRRIADLTDEEHALLSDEELVRLVSAKPVRIIEGERMKRPSPRKSRKTP
jgi:hypothetical protein